MINAQVFHNFRINKEINIKSDTSWLYFTSFSFKRSGCPTARAGRLSYDLGIGRNCREGKAEAEAVKDESCINESVSIAAR